MASPFELSDLFCLDDVPGLVLKTCLKFIGQQSAGEKPVQSLATHARSNEFGSHSVDAAIRLPTAERNSLRCPLPNSEGKPTARVKRSPFSLRPEKQAR